MARVTHAAACACFPMAALAHNAGFTAKFVQKTVYFRVAVGEIISSAIRNAVTSDCAVTHYCLLPEVVQLCCYLYSIFIYG